MIMRIPLDPHAPRTNFLLGVALAGGDTRKFAEAMAKDQLASEAMAKDQLASVTRQPSEVAEAIEIAAKMDID